MREETHTFHRFSQAERERKLNKMAQAQPEDKIHENQEKEPQQETSNSSFKFNVQAPEFVPRSQHAHVPISGYFYPCFQILGGSGESDWFYVGDQDPTCLIPNANVPLPNCSNKNLLNPDLQQKIVKQVLLLYSSYILYSFLF